MPRKQKKYHFIYKTTNSLSGKYYIGMHSTDNLDDGYLGSGRRLRHSINKYGKENHTREILEYCKDRKELKGREEEIVSLNEIAKNECMNLKVGGEGGFNEVDRLKGSKLGNDAFSKKMKDPEYRAKFSKMVSDSMLEQYENGVRKVNPPNWKGRTHSEETKKKMRNIDRTGERNSQFGKRWITNGKESIKVDKFRDIPEGWVAGRKIKPDRNC
jgi:hypothetical protein